MPGVVGDGETAAIKAYERWDADAGVEERTALDALAGRRPSGDPKIDLGRHIP